VAGGWRTQYNEEVQNVNASPHIIRAIQSKGVRHISPMVENGNAYRILIGKSDRRKT
jgi:hypothetical protein